MEQRPGRARPPFKRLARPGSTRAGRRAPDGQAALGRPPADSGPAARRSPPVGRTRGAVALRSQPHATGPRRPGPPYTDKEPAMTHSVDWYYHRNG